MTSRLAHSIIAMLTENGPMTDSELEEAVCREMGTVVGTTSYHRTFSDLVRRGVAKRTAPGTYERAKDPQPQEVPWP